MSGRGRRPTSPISSSVGPAVFGGMGGGGFSIKVNSRGVQRLADKLAKLSATYAQELDTEMGKAAEKTVRRIQVKWPVATGRSRGTGLWKGLGWQKVKKSSLNWSIINPQPYTKYVHYKGSKGRLVNTLVRTEVAAMRVSITKSAKALFVKAMKARPTRRRTRVPGGRLG